eukprot:7117616-Prymnesium_polylepis.3
MRRTVALLGRAALSPVSLCAWAASPGGGAGQHGGSWDRTGRRSTVIIRTIRYSCKSRIQG